MPRIMIVATLTALLTTACGDGEAGDTTIATTSTVTTTSSVPTTIPATTTEQPTTTTTTTTTTTLPEPDDQRPVEASAWGLLCRDLASAGWDYTKAIAYWEVEGRPARMDVDENGIPCETAYPISEVTAYWGDPLPIGLTPGPGNGWLPSTREAPVTTACCSMNHNGPASPPLPPESGPWPDDGAFSVRVEREEGNTASLELEIRRWLPCSERPDQCRPDVFVGDVYADPDNAVVRTVDLDAELLVVIRPIACSADGTWTEVPIEGDGAALASLLRRVDAAAAMIASDYGTIDLETAGVGDPTFPYGRVPCEDLGWVTGYRGPENSFLTDGLYTVFDGDEPTWMYGWWPSLEVVDSTPILYIWAGQIAG